MVKKLFAFVLALAGLMPFASLAEEPQFQSLEEKMQTLKRDVLSLSRDLSKLQNELLAPSTTKFSVFVSLEGKDAFALDSIQLEMDGKPVASYLYTDREQEALRRGGAHRLHAANIPVGPHSLSASYLGKDGSGKERRNTVSSTFEKGLGAKYIEIKIAVDRQPPELVVKEWE